MKSTTLVAATLAALLLSAGTVAALPGNAPVDAGAERTNDDADGATQAATEPSGGETNGRDEADATAGAADRRGPPADVADRGLPVDLPEQVPDHVAEIHELIDRHVAGDLVGSLGDAIGDVTPGDEGDAESGDADGDEERTDGTAQDGTEQSGTDNRTDA